MIFEKIQLEPEEEIISIVHRHWFYLLKQCIFVTSLLIVPLVCFVLFETYLKAVSSQFFSTYIPHIIFVYAAWVLVSWMLLASIWTNYYLDIWCLTNRRIIKVNQVSFFNRKTGSFRLEKLQDITVDVDGFIETMLDFGTLKAETASAEADDFKGTYLPKPQELKAAILKAADSQINSAHL